MMQSGGRGRKRRRIQTLDLQVGGQVSRRQIHSLFAEYSFATYFQGGGLVIYL